MIIGNLAYNKRLSILLKRTSSCPLRFRTEATQQGGVRHQGRFASEPDLALLMAGYYLSFEKLLETVAAIKLPEQ